MQIPGPAKHPMSWALLGNGLYESTCKETFHFEIPPFLPKRCRTSANDLCIHFTPVFATFTISLFPYINMYFFSESFEKLQM